MRGKIPLDPKSGLKFQQQQSTGNYIHNGKIFISSLGLSVNRKHGICLSSTFSDLLLLTQRKKLINSEIGGTRPSPAAGAMPVDKGSQQGRGTWVGLILVESIGAMEDCAAQQATYDTHRAFSTLIAKLFQEARLFCHYPSHVQPPTFLQPKKTNLPRLTSL